MSNRPIAYLWDWYEFDVGLAGIVTGHPEIADGSPIITSKLEWLDRPSSRAETRNTRYILENPRS